MAILKRIFEDAAETINELASKKASRTLAKETVQKATKEAAKEGTETASKVVNKTLTRDELIKANRERSNFLKEKYGKVVDSSKIASGSINASKRVDEYSKEAFDKLDEGRKLKIKGEINRKNKISELNPEEMKKITGDKNIDDIIKQQRNLKDGVGTDRIHTAFNETIESTNKQQEIVNDMKDQIRKIRKVDTSNMNEVQKKTFHQNNQRLIKSYKNEIIKLKRQMDNLEQAKLNKDLSGIRDTFSKNKSNINAKKYEELKSLEYDSISSKSQFATDKFGEELKNKESQFKKKQAKMENFSKQPNASAKNRDIKGVGNNWVYKAAAAGVGGGILFSMFDSRGQQSNAQLYGQQQAY